jgi:hypothetical protein
MIMKNSTMTFREHLLYKGDAKLICLHELACNLSVTVPFFNDVENNRRVLAINA